MKLSMPHLTFLVLFCFNFLQLNKDGVLLLRILDSRLSKDLPSDLQKLRCKNKTDGVEVAPIPSEHLKALHLKEATPKVPEELKSLILGRH
ncbi:hypothetical protein IFM89_023629 [Coptis chinensis]|uniref:Uncharacterized protein n=1 Tax=Coptis chinensis TaxID=261450 RepID=A0A835HNY8_9MAGN|nr:hypothetical protein IFM89_023629 [Coptis chinensis]